VVPWLAVKLAPPVTSRTSVPTLTDDHNRQLEALKRFGNSAHQIWRMLSEQKVGTGQTQAGVTTGRL